MRLAIALLLLTVLPSLAAEPANIIEALQARLDSGQAKLAFADDGHGYLKSVLAALDVPQDSQLLTFTRSSLQFDKISPQHPRALYFRDDLAVGAVHQGEVLEFIVNDKSGAPAFYTMDVKKTDKPRFEVEGNRCLSCHGMVNRYAPGWIVANITAIADGTPQFLDPAKPFDITEQKTDFQDRWGGWYVTGTHGAMRHRGNVWAEDPLRPFELPENKGLNVTDLSDKFDLRQTLKPSSDIVALMTLEHETGFSNRIAALNARYPVSSPAEMDKAMDELVAYMTFLDEAPLPAPVKGTSGFTESFPRAGPRDAKGRSLRDFDLQQRLFRYPLSYMVYSTSFASLNPAAKTHLWQKLHDALLKRPGGDVAIAILAATKSDLPDTWK
ncbi:MAG: hypothetical protein JWN16_132 [Alphaproteobacteria bacterium]|nr:hypothetical protein [Alphaproteobacteria bacterium]